MTHEQSQLLEQSIEVLKQINALASERYNDSDFDMDCYTKDLLATLSDASHIALQALSDIKSFETYKMPRLINY